MRQRLRVAFAAKPPVLYPPPLSSNRELFSTVPLLMEVLQGKYTTDALQSNTWQRQIYKYMICKASAGYRAVIASTIHPFTV